MATINAPWDYTMLRLCGSTIFFDGEGGRSMAGLEWKKPSGFSMKPILCTGITGQSSGRGMWVWPNVYQTTRSVSAVDRFAAVHLGNPSPPGRWLG